MRPEQRSRKHRTRRPVRPGGLAGRRGDVWRGRGGGRRRASAVARCGIGGGEQRQQYKGPGAFGEGRRVSRLYATHLCGDSLIRGRQGEVGGIHCSVGYFVELEL